MKLTKALLGGLLIGGSLLAPVAAQAAEAQVCTRHGNGELNLRRGPSTRTPIFGRIPNRAIVDLSGGFENAPDGFTWYQLKSGAWVRGDFLCTRPQPRPTTRRGPGTYGRPSAPQVVPSYDADYNEFWGK